MVGGLNHRPYPFDRLSLRQQRLSTSLSIKPCMTLHAQPHRRLRRHRQLRDHGAWSGATARSTGWACRDSTARPALRRCSATPEHGRWLIAPTDAACRRVTPHYRGDTLILETSFETDGGARRVIDFMARRDGDVRPGAHRAGHARDGVDAHRAGRALRVWLDRAVGRRVRRTDGCTSRPVRTGCCSTRTSICAARIGEPSANSTSPPDRRSASR